MSTSSEESKTRSSVDGVSPSFEDLYTKGDYLKKQPTWHVEESPWKVKAIIRMLQRNQLRPKTICDVGCGVGEVVKLLQDNTEYDCTFWGYEISPQAFELCKSRANERLHFKLADFTQEKKVFFELLLAMDVFEHVEDYFSFLRALKPKGEYKIFQVPLDISVRSVLFKELVGFRTSFGHIHYFTKELAIQALKDLGYEVLDYFYTMEEPEPPPLESHASRLRRARRLLGRFKRRCLRSVDKVLLTFMPDIIERIFGGWRLLILAK
jgi:SAM-dependent methyltransferase